MSTDDSGPAFPHTSYGGLTRRQYAAIHLRVPNSGLDWLDEMIREANGETTMPSVHYCVDDDSISLPDYYDGEWHTWEGGECPVRGHRVEYMLSDGDILCGDAVDLCWEHVPCETDIIRFRVVKP